MRFPIVFFTALALAVPARAQSPSPSPSPDVTDVFAAQAYKARPKDPEALYDYTFSLIKLQRYAEARKLFAQWRAVAPQDTRHAEVGTLIDRVEKSLPEKRDQVAADWALEQRRAAEKDIMAIKDSMAKVGEGLTKLSSEGASRTATDVPRLKAAAEKDPTAANWLALCEAQVAANDFKAALASARSALAKDPADAAAAASVGHLERYDGKNGDEIRQSLQKERLNQILKSLDK